MPLVRLLYRSDSEMTGSGRAIREAAFAIADHANERNAAVGVTGALMFTGSVFVQLLEGEPAAVEPVFERICRDMRHRRLVLLDYSGVEQRAFDPYGLVAFEADQRVATLFPSISDATSFAQRNPVSAKAAVETMRKLFARRRAQVAKTRGDRMIATEVMP